MAKTLRVRTADGWVTKAVEDLPENRLTAEEIDDNFLALDGAIGDIDADRIVLSDDIRNIVSLTQAEYDLLSPPDANTLYIIVAAV
jgi:hypothetical protein